MKTASLLIIVFAVICVTSLASRAQDQAPVGTERPDIITAPNAIYVELLGSGLLYSINYDRLITDYLGARIGIGYVPDGSLSLTTIPITVSLFPFGASSSKLEIGAGVVQASLGNTKVGSTTGGTYLGYVGILGYRLEPRDGGFLFRFAFTPFILNGHFQPYLGVSFGLAF
jgi:hypothetical protein